MQADGTHRWTGGGTWKPEGMANYVNATWPMVKLMLDGQGGTMLMPFGPDVTFGWREVEKVERVKGLLPLDHGVRFVVSRGRGSEKFNFLTLTRGRAEQILRLAEQNGVEVDRRKHRAWLF